MFDAGFLEMLLVGVIALLVIGPERLPEIAAKVGRFVGKTRAFVANTRSDIERELRAEEMRNLLSKQEEEIRELRDIMQDQGKGLRQELEEARDQLQFSGQQVKDSIGEITRSFKEKPQK